MGIHRDRVGAIAFVVGIVVGDVRDILWISRRGGTRNRIGLEEATARDLVLVHELRATDTGAVALATEKNALCVVADVRNLEQHGMRKTLRDGQVISVGNAGLVIGRIRCTNTRRRAEAGGVCSECANLRESNSLTAGGVVGLDAERGLERTGEVALIVPAVGGPSATHDRAAVAAYIIGEPETRFDEDSLHG